MPLRKLPEFEGWTVDKRLKQFRKVHGDHGYIEFLDFDTDEGDEILCRIIESEFDMEPVVIVEDKLPDKEAG